MGNVSTQKVPVLANAVTVQEHATGQQADKKHEQEEAPAHKAHCEFPSQPGKYCFCSFFRAAPQPEICPFQLVLWKEPNYIFCEIQNDELHGTHLNFLSVSETNVDSTYSNFLPICMSGIFS
jgi:hypothetical protein